MAGKKRKTEKLSEELEIEREAIQEELKNIRLNVTDKGQLHTNIDHKRINIFLNKTLRGGNTEEE